MDCDILLGSFVFNKYFSLVIVQWHSKIKSEDVTSIWSECIYQKQFWENRVEDLSQFWQFVIDYITSIKPVIALILISYKTGKFTLYLLHLWLVICLFLRLLLDVDYETLSESYQEDARFYGGCEYFIGTLLLFYCIALDRSCIINYW